MYKINNKICKQTSDRSKNEKKSAKKMFAEKKYCKH